jgi:hypothetical protein
VSEGRESAALVPVGHPLNRRDLQADCSNCFALCCVVPAFAASADFAIDKPAGQPCPNLQPDFRCGIHTRLRPSGFAGCTVYDCFGAGQKVSQVTAAGQDWRSAPRTAAQLFKVFPVMRHLHELLYYLAEALALTEAGQGPARALHQELGQALEQTEQLTLGRPEALIDLDVDRHRQDVNPLLLRTSELVRSTARPQGRPKDRRGADLIGAKLKRADLRAVNLRGAYLIGADLRGADLRTADLIGVDFRGADLRGADLSGSLFLIQSQLEAARGNPQTRLPAALRHPSHWLAEA